MTVVLHEVGHGLGFVGGFSSQSGIGRLTFSLPFVYDRFAVSGEGDALLNIAQPSVELHAQLTSNNTFVNGPNGIAGNGGQHPKLETHHFTNFFGVTSDNGWRAGSSYSHVDDVEYTGTANGLMTWALNTNEVYTDPGPILKGIFEDFGWTIATTGGPPPITSPAPGSTLTSTTVTFTGGHTASDLQHWLYVGNTRGGANLFDQDMGTGHTATVFGLPTSGTIWVRYWTLFSSGWAFTDQSYVMNVTTTTVPAILSPTPGSTLTTTTVTFTGDHTSADLQHWLYVGDTPGGANLVDENMGTDHTTTVFGLPTSGTIWVRYWTLFSSGWAFTDQSYVMNVTTTTVPAILSPTPGSTLTTTTVTFTGDHTSADLQHWLYVGDTPGGANLVDQDMGTDHTATVFGLPTSGMIWVRYWTLFSSGWAFTDHSYTMDAAATIILP